MPRPPLVRRRRSTCVRAFAAQNSGAISIITALAIPAMVALAGIGTEAGFAYMRHTATKSVAEMAALSGAAALRAGASDVDVEGKAVAASMGFPAGRDAIGVVVNAPPQSGAFKGDSRSVEVIVGQDRQPFFMSYFLRTTYRIQGRAVARYSRNGAGCVLTLDRTSQNALTSSGSSSIDLSGCDSYVNSDSGYAGAVGGSGVFKVRTIYTVGKSTGFTGEMVNGARALDDPYAGISVPSHTNCNYTNLKISGQWTPTVTPGQPVVICNGFDLSSKADVSLPPGVYIIDGGNFTVNGGAKLRGEGVTLIFTSKSGNWPNVSINGGAHVQLKAPTTGPFSGIVMYYDRNAPDSNNASQASLKINGGSSQALGGAIYAPSLSVEYNGSSTVGAPGSSGEGCTQIVVKRLSFTGNSTVGSSCDGSGAIPFGFLSIVLVE